MAQRWTIEKVRDAFEQRGCKLLETQYKNCSTKMRYIATCGHEHSISLNNFLQGKGDLCRACRIRDNADKESVPESTVREVFEEADCEVLLIYKSNGRKRIKYIAQCGHENDIEYHHFKCGGGRVCAECSRSIPYKIDYVREVFEQNDCELLEDQYVNCKTPMRYIAQCGHESFISFDVFQNCPTATKRCRDCHKHKYSDTPEDRDKTASKYWRKAVYARDNWTCQVCGKHGGELNAHHLNAYGTDVLGRFDVDNGITFCPACHIAFHKAYGFGGNTREQFQEWIKGIPRYVGELKSS